MANIFQSHGDYFLQFAIAENESRSYTIPLQSPPGVVTTDEKEDTYDVCWMLDKPVVKSERLNFSELPALKEEDYLRQDTTPYDRAIDSLQK